ncbi:MAG: hypothetical protein HYV42_03335 [Candidatus Magasanikbacteria bacterium]|nr:hypothetical protein [Candidatus Magasanikbacteria bacterium]
MYVYLYDQFLRQRQYAAVARAIEISLTDYGITGKILRLNNFIDVKPLIDDEVKRGAKTVVIVGNDKTFGAVLSRSATCPVTFGFLPIGPGNTIAGVLGIPVGGGAADVLSRRRKERLDIGWVNSRYFVSQLRVPPARVEVFYDDRFKASANDLLEVVVCNLQPFVWRRHGRVPKSEVVHPQDGKLEAFLRPLTKRRWFGYRYEEPSIFPFTEMMIRGREPFVVAADGKITKEREVTIKLARAQVEMIVGRDRKF